MITINRATITSAAQSPVVRRMARCLVGCALAAIPVALDRKTEARTATECGDCA